MTEIWEFFHDWWRKAERLRQHRVGLRQPTLSSFFFHESKTLGEEERRTEGYSDPLSRGLQPLGIVIHWPAMVRIIAARSNGGFEGTV